MTDTPKTVDDWQPIITADESLTDLVRLKGRYPKTETIVEVVGHYDAGGYTEGWVDDRGNHFYATHWEPPYPAPTR